jgi:hypothetical protein
MHVPDKLSGSNDLSTGLHLFSFDRTAINALQWERRELVGLDL